MSKGRTPRWSDFKLQQEQLKFKQDFSLLFSPYFLCFPASKRAPCCEFEDRLQTLPLLFEWSCISFLFRFRIVSGWAVRHRLDDTIRGSNCTILGFLHVHL